MLSDSWPGIDENVEMGLREKKERFSSFKRFTPEKSLFFHCTMAKTLLFPLEVIKKISKAFLTTSGRLQLLTMR